MTLGDEFGSCERRASQMPLGIVQGAQYMNDVVGSVFGKFAHSRNYQRSSEFSGGIWDCKPVKRTVTSKPSWIGTSNNITSKILSLEEIIACDEEEKDTEMKEDDNLLSTQNKPAEVSADASCAEMTVDVKNKRWRSEEFDKLCLLVSNDSETTRKKSKKSVKFSDTVINLEDSPKPTGIASKCVELDIPVIEDNVSGLKETVYGKENKRIKNSAMLVLKTVNDIPVKMQDNINLSEKKCAVKESVKVKNWIKLVSRSSENDLPDQQHNERKLVEVESSKKFLSKGGHRIQKTEFSDCSSKHETTSKRPDIALDVKNEELKNHSHLEYAIPELFEFSESKTKDKVDCRTTKKKLKDELIYDDVPSNIQNLAREVTKSSQSSKESPSIKDTPPNIQIGLSENELKSNSLKEDNVLRQSTKEVNLENVLLEMFDDAVYAKSIANQVVKLAESKQKNKINVMTETEKSKSLLDYKLKNFVPMVGYYNKLDIEDESQYESGKCAVQKEKVCCPPVFEKPSCKQLIFERNEKIGKDTAIEAHVDRSDNASAKVSETLYQGVNDHSNSVSSSRSDACSNWRSQCIDVQQKVINENMTPQNSASRNWRNERTNSADKHDKNSRVNCNYFRRNRQEIKKMDMSLKTDYVDDYPVVVIPLNLSEPPDPSSRFKDNNTDAQSIWDTPEEKAMPNRKNNQIQLQEEIHAFKKEKTTSVPRFFDNARRTLFSNSEISEDIKHSSSKKIDSGSRVKLNENCRSRSRTQPNVIHQRAFERNRSSSAHWRNPLVHTSLEQDVFFIIKIKSHQDGSEEKLKILKEEFLEMKRENSKLSDIIPYPGYLPRDIAYSACAVKMFVRCIFSLSYQIPNWTTALEAFSLGKKFGVNDLMQECEVYFMNYKIPSEQIHQVAFCAKQLQAVDALKSSKFFQTVQDIKSFSARNISTPQSCSVSCFVLVAPSEFSIPLLFEVNRGLESCNESDIKNSVFFRSLTGVTCLTGIELKFLTEDIYSCTELHIVCEVFQNRKKLFYDEFDMKAKSSVKVSFKEEIDVKLSEQVEISVVIEDCLLKMCPQLSNNEVRHGEFHASFESSKTNDRGKKLFCIEKLFYTTRA